LLHARWALLQFVAKTDIPVRPAMAAESSLNER
jgi:hypothetical protein